MIWGLAIYGFAYTALTQQSWSDWMMAAVSFVLMIGLFFRSRITFWGSAIGFAATIGGNLSLMETSKALPPMLLLNMAVSIGALLLHQLPLSMQWMDFRNTRSIRKIFWGVCILVIVAIEIIISF